MLHTVHREVRLAGGPNLCSGRVEVFHGKTWSTVCDADFDQMDAEVVCRDLGCGLPVEVLRAAAFGRGEGQVWSEGLQCRGNESQIHFCPTSSSLKHNCSHDNDVGLVCSGHTQARLVNGSDSCSGRVELLYLSEWGTVCDVSWDMRAASVLCGQLKCGSAVAVLGSDWFGEGSGQIWADVFDCQGNETHLSKCPISSWSRTACSHKQDAGVICSGSSLAFHDGRVRLSGGMECEGELEVYFRQDWRRVLLDSWSESEASVVCRQLGCGSVFSFSSSSPSSPEQRHMCMTGFNCSGSEAHLGNCSSTETVNCSSREQLSITCSEFKEIRLTEGCEGNLEVFYNGTWGNVCVNQMTDDTVSLICQELNCGKAAFEIATRARMESAPNWLDNLKCRRHDSTLWHCPSSPWRQNNCDNRNEVAHITCSDHLPLRLKGGKGSCSGRLEVYHNAEWGSVCDNDWDIRDAQVVCRQLGCGLALSADGSAVFGAAEGPIWLNRVKCRGNEIHLWDCPHSLKDHTDCSHRQDAGVTCAGSVRLVDGGSRCAGRVEVNDGGRWKGVCSYKWDMTDAAVVCRELGCMNALRIATFGSGSHVRLVDGGSRCAGRVEVNDGGQWKGVCMLQWDMTDAAVVCRELGCMNALRIATFGSGSQSVMDGTAQCDKPRLTDGPHECSGRLEVPKSNEWATVCDAGFDQQDAEVVCRELGCGLPVEVLGAAAFGRGDGQARLVNSFDSSNCSGRVELQYLSEWGTVCDVNWDIRAASVLCGQLKCGSAVAVLGSDWFGEGSGQIWADVFDCQGNETHLSKCPISSWSRAACSHEQDAGVICSGSSLTFHEGRVRLSGGMECEGEVEVYFRQDWRRVLLDSWSESEASVVCRQLGCGSVISFSSSSTSSPEHNNMCVTGFNCSGSEAHLGNCSSAQAVNCSSRDQLSITCSGKFNSALSSIRLVGSGGDCAGRLEVFHSGSWGTVCGDLWDIKDAQVVCRQLQCGVALSAPVPAWFGPGTGPIMLNEVQCEGNETSLWNCRFQQCGEDECEHMEDVGVLCSEFKEIRLTEDCKGNLEVFYNGTWGNVCLNQMSDETISMVCRELNCGRSGTEKPFKARVESAPNWLDGVKCRKHDSTLWHCPSSPWRQNSCNKNSEVAYITCSETDISVPSTAATITTTPTTVGQPAKTTTSPSPIVLFIYQVSLFILGVLLFLALVLLVVLFNRNRGLRRVLSKRRRKTLTEAVYEEIDRRYITKRIDSTHQ
ncbi:hypothetical protein MHYP_G00318760, partial [Metynnis hypsauchen]